MPDANRWSKISRRVLAVWAIMSAMSGPFLSGYHFLVSHGRFPAETEHAGTLMVLANVSILTWGVSSMGGISSLFVVGIASADPGELWITIVKDIVVGLFGLACLTGGRYGKISGAVLLVAVSSSLTPLGKWIEERFSEVVGACMIAFVVALLFRSDWLQDFWMWYTGQRDFRMIPSSEMTTGNWFLAILGASVYVLAFAAFQQWRTDGKWFQEIKGRLRGAA